MFGRLLDKFILKAFSYRIEEPQIDAAEFDVQSFVRYKFIESQLNQLVKELSPRLDNNEIVFVYTLIDSLKMQVAKACLSDEEKAA